MRSVAQSIKGTSREQHKCKAIRLVIELQSIIGSFVIHVIEEVATRKLLVIETQHKLLADYKVAEHKLKK